MKMVNSIICKAILLPIVGLIMFVGIAFSDTDLLQPEEAFPLEVVATSTGAKAIFSTVDKYFLYEVATKVKSTNSIIGDLVFNGDALLKTDKVNGARQIYYDVLEVDIPFQSTQEMVELSITSQGCADSGVCYVPITRQFTVDNLALNNSSNILNFDQTDQQYSQVSNFLLQDEIYLSSEQAFSHQLALSGNKLILSLVAKPGYYLYKDKIKVLHKDLEVIADEYPKGKIINDITFGEVEIYADFVDLEFNLPTVNANDQLSLTYQGCAEKKVCYPPATYSFNLGGLSGFDAGASSTSADGLNIDLVGVFDNVYGGEVNNEIFNINSLSLLLLLYFGLGILLAFTPCTFPVIPILSAIILGDKKTVKADSKCQHKKLQNILLPLTFVLSMSVTYAIIGILVAYIGQSFQAQLQQPIFTVLLSIIVVVMALAMIGLYRIQLPIALQTKLTEFTQRTRGGSYIGVTGLGFMSAIIIGPCMTPPLVAAILHIGQKGELLTGGLSLFFLGVGMGVPMVAFALTARKFLPRSGSWMIGINKLIGFLLLGMAIWLVARVIPSYVSMLLLATWLLAIAIQFNFLDAITHNSTFKGIARLCAIPLVMLSTIIAFNQFNAQTQADNKGLEFQQINDLQDLQKHLQQAKNENKIVMLDLEADWCITCREMDIITFANAEVVLEAQGIIKLELDITDNTPEHKELLNKYGIIGPPTIIFLKNNSEIKQSRMVGFVNPKDFVEHLRKIKMKQV